MHMYVCMCVYIYIYTRTLYLGGTGPAKVMDEIFENSFLQKYVQELKMHRVLGNCC